jgi:hypothetical protein
MKRESVDGEAPFALGKRYFFVIAKALAKTPHIMTSPWTERDLAGYGMDCGLVKCAVFLKERIQCGILYDITVVT